MSAASSSNGTTTSASLSPQKQWSGLRRVLERPGPFADPTFQPSSELVGLLPIVRILVIGAGGLGCELLKDLALMGFGTLDVIDMDTIDLANLNRQFLFKRTDIGKHKAEVAANFIMNRIPTCKVTAHNCRIEEKDEDFYRQFQIVVCGLDSIPARRWINSMLVSLVDFDEDQNVLPQTIIPFVDGGTEGFKGNARVIVPHMSACVECTLDLYPPRRNFAMCTIANQPRLPEHCVEWAFVLEWDKVWPFGKDVKVDGDNYKHIQWIQQQAAKRAADNNITGIDFRFTQGVVKRVIPAVASTNAVIASICATEVFKLATRSAPLMDNYTMFNDIEGIYSYTFQTERKDDCPVCSSIPTRHMFSENTTLQAVLTRLIDHYQLSPKPALTADINGKSTSLVMHGSSAFQEHSQRNLEKTLQDLGFAGETKLYVVDKTFPTSIKIIVCLTSSMETTTSEKQ